MSKFNWLRDGDYFIYAEYCSGLFGFAYMGWWLYAAPIVGGEPNKEQAVWLSCDWEVEAVTTGLGLPKYRSSPVGGRGDYKEAFREKYPAGVYCSVQGYGYCCKVRVLVEVLGGKG